VYKRERNKYKVIIRPTMRIAFANHNLLTCDFEGLMNRIGPTNPNKQKWNLLIYEMNK